MKTKASHYSSPRQYFDVIITKTTIRGSKNGPVIKTDVRVKKTPVTEVIFEGYKHGQVFTYITDKDETGDVYKAHDTEEDFVFSSHPSYE